MALRYRTRLSLTISFLIFLTVAAMTIAVVGILVTNMTLQYRNTGVVLTQLANRNIEYGVSLPERVMNRIDEQMIVEALLASELVALAESDGPHSPEAISAALRRVVERSREITGHPLIDEFWVTDETGRAYINSEGREFTFQTSSERPGQAAEFLSLLKPDAKPVVQNLRERELDGKPFKYVGVPGVDKPRIVQVGAGEGLLRSITADFQVLDFIKRFMLPDQFRTLAVIDIEGHVIAAVGPNNLEGAAAVDERIIAFCQNFLRSRISDYQFMPRGRDIGVVTPLANRTGQPYALFIQHRTENSLTFIITRVMLILTIGSIMVLAGILVSLVLSRGLSKPIVALSKGAEEFGKGNLNYRLYFKRRDEFQGLAQAFNTMAISLQEYMHELEQETSRRERLESEVRIASEMQQALLPETPPAIEGLELAGWSQPSKEVGGDFYDFIVMAPGVVALAIGDATGKGVSAALMTTECASILRTLSTEIHEPRELLRRTNEEFFKRVEQTHRFVTLSLIVIDVNRGVAKYASAGHPHPRFFNKTTGKSHWLAVESSFPLGIVREDSFSQVELALQPGDTIVMYSDGLTDAQNFENELYGEDRIVAVLDRVGGRPLEDILEALRDDAFRHMNGRDLFDDMTLVAVRYQPRLRATDQI